MQSEHSIYQTLLGRIRGHQLAALIHVAARCDLADRVGEGRRLSELAQELRLNASALGRILHALAAFDLFEVDDEDFVTQTAASRLLMKDGPRSLHAAASFWGLPCFWQAWGDLEHSMRTGECAFERSVGRPLFNYLEEHPDDERVFDRFMAASPDDRHSAVVAAYDFTRFGCVADIGGGDGMLLAQVLGAAPQARGILFDRGSVVAHPAPGLRAFTAQGRCGIVPGSFFEHVPEGADAYLLSQIVHDWDDDAAAVILRNCRKAMAKGAVLLVIERVLDLKRPDRNVNNFLSDIEMLVLHKAAERTTEEYRNLLRQAGFRVERIIDTSSPFSVLECMTIE